MKNKQITAKDIKMKILLVDDYPKNKFSKDLIDELKLHHNVDIICKYVDLKNIFEKINTYNLVFVDILLEYEDWAMKDGWEIANEIREKFNNLIILYSRLHRDIYSENLMKIEKTEYLRLPLDYSDLAKILYTINKKNHE